MFQHILVAHDLSHEADIALHRAIQLARQHGARLTLLHVLEDHLPNAVQSNLRDAAQHYFNEHLARLGAEDCQLLLRKGRPAQQILEEMGDIGADLLVIGRHHHNAPELFIGTTLERVARHLAAPLLLVVGERPERPYQNAAVALDFSLCACDALRMGCTLVPRDAQLVAINVMELGNRLLSKSNSSADFLATQRELLENVLEDELSGLSDEVPAVAIEVVSGALPRALDEAISAHSPQLLALGSHGRSLISQALLGSLALRYLQNPPCDLLLVK
ncbi:universal stress protein [Pseudomonas sp. JS3066]|uniref:universal stress protein n=1 Tax=unclassified Pseudomonas TaxID=196821 RepID=UPI000EAA1363|nr:MULTISPECIES: universal stress protein [unclassified Pseudomonas]AYF89715.1 universal stress protein [Pseudomonas sp. DY-1]WVK92712.1 universal stress protein [Pseudomonas sp. JS3066]